MFFHFEAHSDDSRPATKAKLPPAIEPSHNPEPKPVSVKAKPAATTESAWSKGYSLEFWGSSDRASLDARTAQRKAEAARHQAAGVPGELNVYTIGLVFGTFAVLEAKGKLSEVLWEKA
ncbi:hypothetical protein Q8F55_005408 [Vanrija albida]|uniref:Uncharacterized protein n=1 Tax=Vanrija albida TaxID=181172 RepID=A0ABR3Q1L4_9TREE